jgi:hypothetical protein
MVAGTTAWLRGKARRAEAEGDGSEQADSGSR